MFILDYIKEQQAFKKLILKAQKAEMNSTVNKEDKLGLKWYTYVTIFILSNATIGGLYLFKQQIWRKGHRLAFLSFFLSSLFYFAYFQWQIRTFATALEGNQNQIAYWFRTETLEHFSQHWAIKNRKNLLKIMNENYQRIYLNDL